MHLCRFAAQQPTHQIHIVNTQIHEDTAKAAGHAQGSLNGRFRIDTGTFHHVGRADGAGIDLLLCVDIAFVISPHKARHTHQFRMPLRSHLCGSAAGRVRSQRFFKEHMHTGIQRQLDLPAVQIRRCDEHHGIRRFLCQHLGKILIAG